MTHTEIHNLITTLLNHLPVEVDEVKIVEEDGRVRVAITSSDSRHLIGTEGAHLSALNHLAKRISEKQGIETPFSIDVNDYYEAGLEAIRNKARVNAERARSFKTNIELEPMNSYERMVVHSALADIPDIKTESSGYGRERRIVICYSPAPEGDDLDAKI